MKYLKQAAFLTLTLFTTACGTLAPEPSSRISKKSSRQENLTSHDRKNGRALSRKGTFLIQRGLASWYGKRFRGRKTASGELFDPKAMTAAHRTLPLGTKVRVECPLTGKSVIVTITDRGPYAHKRIIDLSYAAARKLGIIARGVAFVQLEAVP